MALNYTPVKKKLPLPEQPSPIPTGPAAAPPVVPPVPIPAPTNYTPVSANVAKPQPDNATNPASPTPHRVHGIDLTNQEYAAFLGNTGSSTGLYTNNQPQILSPDSQARVISAQRAQAKSDKLFATTGTRQDFQQQAIDEYNALVKQFNQNQSNQPIRPQPSQANTNANPNLPDLTAQQGANIAIKAGVVVASDFSARSIASLAKSLVGSVFNSPDKIKGASNLVDASIQTAQQSVKNVQAGGDVFAGFQDLAAVSQSLNDLERAAQQLKFSDYSKWQDEGLLLQQQIETYKRLLPMLERQLAEASVAARVTQLKTNAGL